MHDKHSSASDHLLGELVIAFIEAKWAVSVKARKETMSSGTQCNTYAMKFVFRKI